MSDLAKRLRSQEAIPNRNEVADYIDALKADKAGLQEQVGKLLSMLDAIDAAMVADDGGLSMHTHGQTPDWFVEAAFWSCYGHAPNDPRANLEARQ